MPAMKRPAAHHEEKSEPGSKIAEVDNGGSAHVDTDPTPPAATKTSTSSCADPPGSQDTEGLSQATTLVMGDPRPASQDI
eukprot:5367843-Alexandrium_andersonii.AAC.1